MFLYRTNGTKIFDRENSNDSAILNEHLSTRTWLELDRPTIADIAVFPYIALARDGKIDLNAYPHVLNWIDRIKQISGYISMTGI